VSSLPSCVYRAIAILVFTVVAATIRLCESSVAPTLFQGFEFGKTVITFPKFPNVKSNVPCGVNATSAML